MQLLLIQDSFEDVIQDVASGSVKTEAFWVSKRNSADEEHQKLVDVEVRNSDGKVAFITSEKFSKVSAHKYTVAIDGENYTLVSCTEKWNVKDISAMAVSQAHVIIGSGDGSLIYYNRQTTQKEREVKGAHLGSVSSIHVFPSQQAIVTTGADFQTKLWSPLSEEPVRVFRHQKGELTGLVLVGRGRNFLTSSRDGGVDLWECGLGNLVCSFSRIDGMKDPATCVAVLSLKITEDAAKPLMFEYGDKVLYVGYQSGVIQPYHLGGHYQMQARFTRKASVCCLRGVDDHVIAGYADGVLVVWSQAGEKVLHVVLNENWPVESIHVESSTAENAVVVVSNGPDLVVRINLNFTSTTPAPLEYLVGLSETALVHLIAGDDTTFVATRDQLAIYKAKSSALHV